MTGTVTDMETPVTVVLPVHNALPFLDEAIASILAQTHRNLRLAIYDDCSTDGSYEAALEWKRRDDRVTVARGTSRLGPCGSSNAAAAMATTELVARMDADDLMMPDRLEVQLAALARYPDAVLVGSTFDLIDGTGRITRPAAPGRIGGSRPPIAHPSIFYRRAAMEAIGGYHKDTDYFEDQDLYRRMALQGAIVVINRPLIQVRFAGQHTRLGDDPVPTLHLIDRQNRRQPSSSPTGRSISPMAFYSLANLSIMGAKRPRLLGTMLRKVSFEQPLLVMLVMAIVAMAEVSPRLARWAWQVVTTVRDRFEVKAQSDAEAYVWQRGNPAG